MNDIRRRPTEIRLAKDKRTLTVTFESGEKFELSAEYLRVESPSAEVKGHTPSQRQTVPGKRQVEIMSVAPVGHYAVRIAFTDLHDTGLYSWDYLYELGAERDARWAAYLAELAEKGLSRDSPARK
ncbi:MAG: DUF971 domain-containing protein [Hyphomicrobiales bacterium]|nr:DUF971 domain-containing protein [Hyphomicrobiales bacterium]